MTDFRYPNRIAALREMMARPLDVSGEENSGEKEKDTGPIDAMMVSHLENARYLSGFTGSNALLLVSADNAFFFTDGRYIVQSSREVPGFERIILTQGASLSEAAGEAAKKLGLKRVGFEDGRMSVREFAGLQKVMPETVELVPRSGLVEEMRRVKDSDEIAALKRAVALADNCFTHIQKIARPGTTEKQVAWEIEVFLRNNGAERLSFESIVASGPNAALPHARPSDRKLGETGPEFVILDYGAELGGYCSDITRTLVVGGEPTPRHVEIYEAVKRAQQAALDAIRPDVPGKEIDNVARQSLTKAGFGEEFSHGLGHLLGREVHDSKPFAAGFSPKSDLVTKPGMVITVEPGVYIEGFGGVRIEDDIVVTETGCEVLTQSTKELIAIP